MASTGPKVTPNMKKGVSICEEILGVKCPGRDFDSVKKYLDENLPKIQGKNLLEFREPSDKQLNAIAKIQEQTGDVYTGRNQKDASEFISKHYQEVFGSYKKGKKK